jgi:hypothetical protein
MVNLRGLKRGERGEHGELEGMVNLRGLKRGELEGMVNLRGLERGERGERGETLCALGSLCETADRVLNGLQALGAVGASLGAETPPRPAGGGRGRN